MQKFTTLKAVAAPMRIINVDTDKIIPKQFLTTVHRSGLGKSAFYEIRYDAQGNPNPDFVLNKPQYMDAEILVAEDNFGCGSSREHAPWALVDFGFKAIIAPSFADIFYNNSFKNGLLLIKLPKMEVEELMKAAEWNQKIEIDLEKQAVSVGDRTYHFEIDPFKKYCLLNGLDDIGLTLQKEDKIKEFEAKQKQQCPWL